MIININAPEGNNNRGKLPWFAQKRRDTKANKGSGHVFTFSPVCYN